MELVYEMMDSDGEIRNAYYEKDDSEDESKDWVSDDDKYESDMENRFPYMRDYVSSLEKICLKNISENFERFNMAYKTTEDAALRRNLIFLQRVYSQPVFSEATYSGYVNDSSLNFVLNEYLKELNFKDLVTCSPEAILKRLAEIGHGINAAIVDTDFCSPSFSNPVSFVNEALGYLPNVNVLHIFSIADDETLKVISSCCLNLKELHLDNCDITDEGVKSLCAKRDRAVPIKCCLKLLSLRYTKVEAAGVAFLLENLPSLETLQHHNLPTILYSMHKNDVVNNGLNPDQKYNLTTLDLNSHTFDKTSNLSNVLKVWVAVCPHIKELRIQLEKEQLDLIALFSELEKLSLDCLNSDGQQMNLSNFLRVRGGKLTELKVSHASFSVFTLIQNCPKLKSLNLVGTSFLQEGDCNNTSLLNNLQELRLENFTFAEPSVETSVATILNCSPKLEDLYLSHCETAHSEINTTIVNFCSKKAVKKLSFNYSDVRICFLESILLESCSSLETLIIQDCDYIHTDDISSLYTILHSEKANVNIIWNDDRSELYSLEDFSDYDFHDSDVDLYDDYYEPDDFDDDFRDDECYGYGFDYYD